MLVCLYLYYNKVYPKVLEISRGFPKVLENFYFAQFSEVFFMKYEYNAIEVKNRIFALLKQRNLKAYTELPKIGLSKNTLDKANTSMPKADTLARIADFLGVSVDYLLGRSSPALAPDEQQLVEAFRACPENDKQYLLDTVILYANRAKTSINVEVT